MKPSLVSAISVPVQCPSTRSLLICASQYLGGLPTRRSCYSSSGIAQRASIGGIAFAARPLRRLFGKVGKLDTV